MLRLRSVGTAITVVLLLAGWVYAQSSTCTAASCGYLPLMRLDPTATPVPPTPTPPAPSLHVTSYRMVYTTADSINVYGEVENTTTKPAYLVKVVGKFYDAAGNFVATDYTYTGLTKTEVGGHNPFNLYLGNAPAGITRVDLTLSSDSTSLLAYVPVTVLSQQTRDNFGLELFGEVRNDQSRQVRFAVVAVTFYDAGGKVYYTNNSYADVTTLNPGATSTYKISTFQDDLAGLNYTVQAQGYIAP